MTNKTLITILIVSLILFNAYLLVTNISNKNKSTEFENFDQTITDYILEYQGISDYMLQNDGFSLDSIAVVDLENNSIDFNQLLKNHGNNILVCRTSPPSKKPSPLCCGFAWQWPRCFVWPPFCCRGKLCKSTPPNYPLFPTE